MNQETHTHYDPYGPPRQVAGTLLDCDAAQQHSPDRSEIFADYMYTPRMVPSGSTGLPPEAEKAVMDWRRRYIAADAVTVITEATRLDDGYEVKISNLWMDGTGFHTETFQYEGGVVRPRNPHPPYEHTGAWCANCGY